MRNLCHIVIIITLCALPVATGWAQQQTVAVKENRNQQAMTTKVYTLKHVQANNLCPFIDGAVKRSNSGAGAMAARAAAGELLIVSMPVVIVKEIDAMIARMDRPAKKETVKVIVSPQRYEVISKTYILKHADPYEIRPILRAAVGCKRINRATTGVDCIRYRDGRGAVIVSAEAYRFEKQKYGISIDELVAKLDQPQATTNDDDIIIIGRPAYGNARWMKRFIMRMGFSGTRSDQDGVVVDPDTNAVIIRSAPFRKKTIDSLIRSYNQ